MIFLNYKYFKHLILVSLSLLMSINLLYSQSRRDNTKDFESEAPMLIADLVYSFMEEVQAKTRQISEKELSDREITGMSKFKDQLLNNDSVKISDINIFLSDTNNGWSNNGHKLFNAYENQMKNGNELIDILNVPEEVRTVNYKNGPILIENHNDEILKKYDIQNYYRHKSGNRANQNNTNTNENQKDIKQKNNVNFFSWWNIILYVIIFLLISRHIFIAYQSVKKEDTEEELQNIINKRGDEIRDLNKKIRRLENIVSQNPRISEEPKRYNASINEKNYYENNVNRYLEKEDKICTDSKPVEKLKEDYVSSKEEITEFVSENKRKYFRFPNDDGSFDMYDGQSSPETRSFYEIEFSETLGVLRFRNNNSDKVILQDIYKRLFPVADLVEDSNVDSPTKIEIKGNGKVELVNNKWIIIEKIKVKLL